jgi:hypothetical protein
MSIAPGTPVKLADGRDGIVIPPTYPSRNRVLVKVAGGKKTWFSIEDCTPVLVASWS